MKSEHTFAFLMIVVLALTMLVVAIINSRKIDTLKKEAIENGYAICHPVNGDFTWKCNLEEKNAIKSK